MLYALLTLCSTANPSWILCLPFSDPPGVRSNETVTFPLYTSCSDIRKLLYSLPTLLYRLLNEDLNSVSGSPLIVLNEDKTGLIVPGINSSTNSLEPW